jgi:hypothetical protein
VRVRVDGVSLGIRFVYREAVVLYTIQVHTVLEYRQAQARTVRVAAGYGASTAPVLYVGQIILQVGRKTAYAVDTMCRRVALGSRS